MGLAVGTFVAQTIGEANLSQVSFRLIEGFIWFAMEYIEGL